MKPREYFSSGESMEKTGFDRQHFSCTTFKGQEFKGESIPSQTTDTNFGSYLSHQLLSKNWRICPLTKWKLTTHVWLGLQLSHTSMIACETAQKTSYNSPARYMRHSLASLTPTSICNALITPTLLSLQPFFLKPPGPGTSCSIPSAWTALLPSSLPRKFPLILPESAQMSPPPASSLGLPRVEALPAPCTHFCFGIP